MTYLVGETSEYDQHSKNKEDIPLQSFWERNKANIFIIFLTVVAKVFWGDKVSDFTIYFLSTSILFFLNIDPLKKQVKNHLPTEIKKTKTELKKDIKNLKDGQNNIVDRLDKLYERK